MSEDSFENLVNEHGQRVMDIALRVLGDVHLANDAYQEVFLAIWRRWSKYDGQVNWGAYLYRVAVRKALEVAKSRGAAVPVPTDSTECQSIEADPDVGLRFDELQQKLTGSLAKLPKLQADVFVLSRIEGLSHGAIAEILGCTRNAVRVSLHRAVKRLAKEMRTYESGRQQVTHD